MMKRLSALLPIVLLTAVPAAASVTLSVDAGILSNNTGTPIADGDLVLLLASPDAAFTPTVGSEFVSGDDLILAAGTASSGNVAGAGAFGMNSSQTTPGETLNTLSFNY